MWGSPPIEVPEEVLCKWGARAIKENPGFSLLHDRQNAEYTEKDRTENNEEIKAFFAWLDGSALPQARKWALTQASDSFEKLTLDKGRYHYQASCNGSYGYVYMASWFDKAPEVKDEVRDSQPVNAE